MKKIITLIAISMLIFVYGCSFTSVTVIEDDNKLTNISSVPPTDNTLPTDHTGLENISYMIYNFEHQTAWHSYTYVVSKFSGITQYTHMYRDKYNDVLISSGKTYSSSLLAIISNQTRSSSQTLYYEDYAYVRQGSASKNSEANLDEITWSDDAPTIYSREDYYGTYGLFANDLSLFILNSYSIIDVEDVEDNGDGTYTQTFSLDGEISVYYYKNSIMTNADITSAPAFESVSITLTCDSEWNVLKLESTDVSKVTKGVTVTNTSNTTVEFSYGEQAIDQDNLDYFDSFYSQYIV